MAEFSIIFDEMLNSPPRYEDYSVIGPLGSCGEDAQIHPITFNDISTGDYVVGYNWDSPIGLPPGNIRIESFTDTTETYDTVLNVIANVQTTPANTLKDTTTGLNLVYPYITPISNLPNIVEVFTQSEITCYEKGSAKFRNTRTRKIKYVIFDTDGNAGPVCDAIYQNTAPI